MAKNVGKLLDACLNKFKLVHTFVEHSCNKCWERLSGPLLYHSPLILSVGGGAVGARARWGRGWGRCWTSCYARTCMSSCGRQFHCPSLQAMWYLLTDLYMNGIESTTVERLL